MSPSRTTTPPFKILPGGEDDCEAFAHIEAVSFNELVKQQPETNLFRLMFGPSTEESKAFRTNIFIDTLKNDPTTRYWKAVVPDPEDPAREKTVACALWHFYLEPFPGEEWKDIEWPPFMNAEAGNDIIGDIVNVKAKHMKGEPFGFLYVIATLPEYRGQGIASALIGHGINEAVSEGLKSFWLDASDDGHSVYEKHGFRDVENIEKDIAKYGGSGKATIIGMKKTIP